MMNAELDARVPDDWREHVRALRQENASRRRENEALRKRMVELQTCVWEHEEDCAVLHEDRSVSETVNALRACVAERGAEVRRFRAALEAHEEVKAKLQAEVARLGAENAALDWCGQHRADIEFNQYAGAPAEVRVKYLADYKTGEWREATAATLADAVAMLKEEKP